MLICSFSSISIYSFRQSHICSFRSSSIYSFRQSHRLFADGTAVYLTVSGPNDSNILQSVLSYLQEWERTLDMEFNSSKCQVQYISRARQPIHSQYNLHGEILEPVDYARYLGVGISKDLSRILTSVRLQVRLIEL